MTSFRKSLAAGAAMAIAMLAAPLAAETVAIRAGSVLVDATSEASGPATILVTDGKIVSIIPGHGAVTADREIDLKTRTVLPGLIDLHTHLTGDPGGDFWKEAVEPEEWGMVIGAKNARLTALAGFTTVREAGSGKATAFSLRRGTAEGLVPGPRIVAAGPALSPIVLPIWR